MSNNELNEITKKLRLNFVFDLRKQKIDKFERASIIRKVMDDNKWSIRQMAKQIGMDDSTVEDWLLFTKIDEDKYKELTSKGVTDTEIYRQLRNRGRNKERSVIIENYVTIDYKINKFEQDLKGASHEIEYSEYTIELLNELQKEIEKFKKEIKNEQIRKVKNK